MQHIYPVKNKIVLFLLLMMSLPSVVWAQLNISGRILDSLHQSPLAYVNIGIKNKNIGTVSTSTGSFELHIPKLFENDTLTFSLVGYSEINLPLQGDQTENSMEILLSEKTIQLDHVLVIGKKHKEQKFGIKRRGTLIHFSDGMFNPEDSFEIGQLIKLGESKIKVTSLNFFALNSDDKPRKFRINFYRYREGKPREKIVHKNLIQSQIINKGWVKFDLADQNIYLSGEVIAALEFLPTEDLEQKQINYEVKLGGSSKSYYRKSSLGGWNTPPHHYCLHITGLASIDTPIPDDDYVSAPTFNYTAKALGEDYAIYVHLPKDYQQDQASEYPVIYLLDANAFFDPLKNYIDEEAEKNKLSKEPIIIGVGYENAYLMDSLRIRDYTYPKALAQDSFPTSGGADKFYSFLKNELIPYIDRNYHTDTNSRILAGHSFGGYFTLFALLQDMNPAGINHPVFSHYISASPSINYHDHYILSKIEKLDKHSSNRRLKKTGIYLTIGSNELEGEMKQLFPMLNQLLKVYQPVKSNTKVYQDLDHMGTAIPTFQDAIRNLFQE